MNDCARIPRSSTSTWTTRPPSRPTRWSSNTSSTAKPARGGCTAAQLRAAMRERPGRAMRAPEALHLTGARRGVAVGAAAALAPRSSASGSYRAAATAIVAWIVLPWGPAEETGIYRAMAVGEHRACALERVVQPRAVSYYEPDALMPLLPDSGGKVRIVEAHLCGQQSDYMHVDSRGRRHQGVDLHGACRRRRGTNLSPPANRRL